MHSTRGMVTNDPLVIEAQSINKKRGSNRTVADEARGRLIEAILALWVDAEGRPTVPAHALRACIERGARALRQGAQVRGGLVIASVGEFDYGQDGPQSQQDVAAERLFVVPVMVGQSRVLRARPKFDEWAVSFMVDTDPELVDESQLDRWLDIAGRRVGLGDWRPEKSGHYGRFTHTITTA